MPAAPCETHRDLRLRPPWSRDEPLVRVRQVEEVLQALVGPAAG
jgi:hypothetical protein